MVLLWKFNGIYMRRRKELQEGFEVVGGSDVNLDK